MEYFVLDQFQDSFSVVFGGEDHITNAIFYFY